MFNIHVINNSNLNVFSTNDSLTDIEIQRYRDFTCSIFTDLYIEDADSLKDVILDLSSIRANLNFVNQEVIQDDRFIDTCIEVCITFKMIHYEYVVTNILPK